MATQKQPKEKVKVIDTTIDSDDSDTEINDDTEDLLAVQLDDNSDADDVDEIELSGRDERADLRTVASRQRLHDKLLSDVEAFLANGGQIDQLSSYVNAGPPKRHVNKFGSSSM
jgi:hypothetical protein